MPREEDQRAYFRHPIRVPVRVEKNSRQHLMTRSRDISFGGIAFSSPEGLSRGERVKVNFPYQDDLLEIEARVIYSVEDPDQREYRTGVVFESDRHEYRDRLAGNILAILRFGSELSSRMGRKVTETEAGDLWVEAYAQKHNIEHNLLGIPSPEYNSRHFRFD